MRLDEDEDEMEEDEMVDEDEDICGSVFGKIVVQRI